MEAWGWGWDLASAGRDSASVCPRWLARCVNVCRCKEPVIGVWCLCIPAKTPLLLGQLSPRRQIPLQLLLPENRRGK